MTQLSSIRLDMCRDLTLNAGLVKIALEVIVFYAGSKNKTSVQSLIDMDFKALAKYLFSNLKTDERLDMEALWILNSRLTKPFEYPNGTFEIYPAVGFIANISEMKR